MHIEIGEGGSKLIYEICIVFECIYVHTRLHALLVCGRERERMQAWGALGTSVGGWFRYMLCAVYGGGGANRDTELHVYHT